MSYPRLVVTDRLELRPMDPADADALYPIFSDPAGWWYDPDGRHVEPHYRLATGEQGRGYATELAAAARDAAGDVDPDVAFIAWVAEHNLPSRRLAERLGLTSYGLRVDASDGRPRLAYADRALDDGFASSAEGI